MIEMLNMVANGRAKTLADANRVEAAGDAGQAALAHDLAALHAMTVDELAAKHAALFGRAPRTRHRGSVMHSLAFELQRRELGGISEEARARLDELVAEAEVLLRAPSTSPPTPTDANATTAAAPAERTPPRPPLRPNIARCGLLVATTLTREWRGRKFVAVVNADSIDVHDGETTRRFASLSAAASALSGTKWNGRIWWRVASAARAPKESS